jgi:diguanylate cyclase (GGDEF)-like protein
VASGEADFFIENNTVAEYYINELDYKNLTKKGVLSENSFLYFGINKDKKALTSIFDKSIDLINYEKLRAEGLASAPDLVSPREERMRLLIIFLCLIVVIIGYFLYKIFNELIDKKAQTKLLKEKEKLLYLDPLTQLRNRNYLNHIEKSLDDMPYPQGFIISDLNDLKETNDQYGHLIGDALIVKYSEILKETFQGWTIFRTGGDEFLLFKPAVSQKAIDELIQQNRQVSDQAVIETDDYQIVGISAAIGYTIREQADETINQMIKEADEAMYIDKKGIDNGCSV